MSLSPDRALGPESIERVEGYLGSRRQKLRWPTVAQMVDETECVAQFSFLVSADKARILRLEIAHSDITFCKE
jgi:hypothetical protein